MGHLLPIYPTIEPKKQNLEKMKKIPGDIIILRLCKTNDDHMTHGSWDTERDRQFFFILDHFCPVTPVTTQKIKILNNEKNARRYHFTQVYQKWQSYDVWFLTDRIFLSFWAIFCPFTPLKTWKNNILKNTWRYQFPQVYEKSWSHAILFLRYGTWRM